MGERKPRVEVALPATYEESIARLNELAAQLEGQAVSLEEIEGVLAEADALVQFCRQRLHETKGQMEETVGRWVLNESSDYE
ncbi:MAG: exodeoxyribonuclease VII small subunit [Bacteroidetes bacterium]|nr:MAG: exodeoxyribonuclease VII small subunit [Bacteroidota bacterium]